MRSKIRIGLVDDHKLFRDGIRSILEGYENFSVVLEADHGRDMIAKISTGQPPDVILLDVSMSEMDGVETAQWLRANLPDVRVLALSMFADEATIIRMLRSGARGYLLKDAKAPDLYEALKLIAETGYYHNEKLSGKIIHALNTLDTATEPMNIRELISLSPKETELLKWVCTELTYKEIADRMNVSPHTVEGYRDAMCEKLGIRTRIGLAMYAIRSRIVIVQ